ncbi:MAG: MFS transporter [Chloroflexota bacterium]
MAAPELLTPLKERDFARLWFGQMVSNSGDWVNYVALTALVWELTESAWMIAVLRACHALPLLLLGPFSGVFVDRWNRKTTLIATDLIRGGLVLLFPLVQDVNAILLIALAFNVVSTVFTPAKNAIIPQVISRERLLAANSLSSTTQNIAMIVGPTIGGIILASGGWTAAFCLDSATFFVSAVAIASMSISGVVERKPGEQTSALDDLSEGFRFAAGYSPVRSAMLMELGVSLGWGCLNVLAIVIAENVLGGGATEYGLLLTSIGIGALTGAVISGQLGKQVGLNSLFPIGFVLLGFATAGLAGSRILFAASAAYFFIGTGRILIEVAATTTYQRSVPDALRGRIFSLRHMVTHTAILAANQMAGFFTDAASVPPILISAAVILLIFVPFSYFLIVRPSQDKRYTR